MHDVIVVGVGPGGAVAATELSRAGLSVLALEGQAHPRYKVCGGGLSSRIDRLLDADFRSVVEDTIFSVRFQFAGSDSFQVASPDPVAYMVMRDRFDAYLADKARAAGTRVRENERAIAVRENEEGVEVETERGHYRARILVGADGATSLVARSLFTGRRGRLWGALEGEAMVPAIPRTLGPGTIALDLGVVPWGYGWVFPKAGRLSVGVAGFHGGKQQPKDDYDRFVKEEPVLDGIAAPPGRGHPIPLYGGASAERQPLSTKRALVIGDAAHLVDPVLGEGIYYAILSAKLAAASITEHLRGRTPDLKGYDARIAADIYPEFRKAARMAQAVYTFPRAMHQALQRRSDIVRLYCDVLSGRETYQTFFAAIRERVEAFLSRMVRDKAAAIFGGGG